MARFSQHLEQMHSVKNYLFTRDTQCIACVQLPSFLKQNQGPRKVPSGSPRLINNGNRTEWSPIQSAIMRVTSPIVCMITEQTG